ncbi:zf-RVT domain-containing protein, partial [Cephalotus follicularis]
IMQMSQFRQDTLPVKYLGLPLISSRLTKLHCAPLVEKIMARVNRWVSKSLSYAGRLQLIKSTMASMQLFWCSIFLLPSAVIVECERLMRKFLWGGSGTSSKKSLVKWLKVCLPVQEGGLGIKSMKAWNQKHSFWNLPTTGSLSWAWRQILHLRNIALCHLVYICGRGDKFSLWHDPWFHGCSITTVYGHRIINDSGIADSARVQDVIANDHWCWPATSPDLIEIQYRVQDIPISTSYDRIFWGSVGQPFSTKKAWELVRESAPPVRWANLVWHSSRISKHAFCLWLAILGAHRTRDKLLTWGLIHSACCLFNCGENESEHHLFFECPYTRQI